MTKHMKRLMLSVSEEMWDALEEERKTRRLVNLQEVIRQILADHLRQLK